MSIWWCWCQHWPKKWDIPGSSFFFFFFFVVKVKPRNENSDSPLPSPPLRSRPSSSQNGDINRNRKLVEEQELDDSAVTDLKTGKFLFYSSTVSWCFEPVSWCFEPSQPLGIISGLRVVSQKLMKTRYSTEEICRFPVSASVSQVNGHNELGLLPEMSLVHSKEH